MVFPTLSLNFAIRWPHRDWVRPVLSECLLQWPAIGTGVLAAADLGSMAHIKSCLARRLPLAPPQSHWADDPQTGEQLYPKKFSHCCKSSRTHNRFPSLGVWQRDWEHMGIWLWRPVGFYYRTCTGLRKQTIEGHQKKPHVHQDPGERSSDPTRDWARLACECPGSLAEAWMDSGLLQGIGHWTTVLGAVAGWHKSFWKRSPWQPLPLHYPYIWPQVKL